MSDSRHPYDISREIGRTEAQIYELESKLARITRRMTAEIADGRDRLATLNDELDEAEGPQ